MLSTELSTEELGELGDFLAERLAPPDEAGPGRPCDHTLSLTEHWLHQRGVLDTRPVCKWLQEEGGFCDCEVLLNVVLRGTD
jgi:hypothetical protein